MKTISRDENKVTKLHKLYKRIYDRVNWTRLKNNTYKDLTQG